ncbi:alpha/beta hydrolase [Rothia nasimurium]|uniref:alpha/beta hydrolase n=1 Tax=Rothia nasimurium TaxID=85336 RepID=UPI001F4310CF|nr:alpha/beta hydrolase [Rothia nasimurium]
MTTLTGNYAGTNHPSQTFDFYPPSAPTGEHHPVPLLIYVHGGAWRFGDKSSFLLADNGLHRIRERFAHAGYATASINYRLSHEALFPAQINDLKTAIRYFKTRAEDFGIDPNRIVLAGGSAGGHLVQLAAATGHLNEPYLEGLSASALAARTIAGEPDSSVRCAVSIYGVSDLRTIFDDRVAWGFPYDHPEDDGAEWRLLGSTYPAPAGSPAEINWAKAHPIDYVQEAQRTGERTHAPVYYIHGTADTCVPPNQSVEAHRALSAAGIPTELTLIGGAEHSDPAIYASESTWEHIIRWVGQQLTL